MSQKDIAGQPGAAQDQNPEDTQKNNYATVDQLAEMARQFNGMSAALRKIQEAITSAPQSTPDGNAEPEPKPVKKSQADIALENRIKALDEEVKGLNAEKEKLKMRTFNQLTREACTSKRVSDQALDPLVSYMRTKYGERMVLDEDRNQIIVQPPSGHEDFEKPKLFSDVLQEYLAGAGAWALPAAKLPSGESMKSQQSFVTSDGSHKFKNLTAAQIEKHPDKAAFADFIKNHPDEWSAKLQEAIPS